MKQKVLAIGDLSQYVEPGVPVGFVGYWMGTVNNIPEGWFICNGSTFNATLYPKLYKALNDDNVVPNMTTESRFIRCSTTAGVEQGDAIRNITGEFSYVGIRRSGWASGAFQGVHYNNTGCHEAEKTSRPTITFDASRVVPTANENRPINISAIPIIKHD